MLDLILTNGFFEIFTIQEKWDCLNVFGLNIHLILWRGVFKLFVFPVIHSVWPWWLLVKSSGRPRTSPNSASLSRCECCSSRWRIYSLYTRKTLTVCLGAPQLQWAAPVPGRGEEEGSEPAADVALSFIPCGTFRKHLLYHCSKHRYAQFFRLEIEQMSLRGSLCLRVEF